MLLALSNPTVIACMCRPSMPVAWPEADTLSSLGFLSGVGGMAHAGGGAAMQPSTTAGGHAGQRHPHGGLLSSLAQGLGLPGPGMGGYNSGSAAATDAVGSSAVAAELAGALGLHLASPEQQQQQQDHQHHHPSNSAPLAGPGAGSHLHHLQQLQLLQQQQQQQPLGGNNPLQALSLRELLASASAAGVGGGVPSALMPAAGLGSEAAGLGGAAAGLGGLGAAGLVLPSASALMAAAGLGGLGAAGLVLPPVLPAVGSRSLLSLPAVGSHSDLLIGGLLGGGGGHGGGGALSAVGSRSDLLMVGGGALGGVMGGGVLGGSLGGQDAQLRRSLSRDSTDHATLHRSHSQVTMIGRSVKEPDYKTLIRTPYVKRSKALYDGPRRESR
jgi:hypothetical protein